jgi:hypothetical protein
LDGLAVSEYSTGTYMLSDYGFLDVQYIGLGIWGCLLSGNSYVYVEGHVDCLWLFLILYIGFIDVRTIHWLGLWGCLLSFVEGRALAAYVMAVFAAWGTEGGGCSCLPTALDRLQIRLNVGQTPGIQSMAAHQSRPIAFCTMHLGKAHLHFAFRTLSTVLNTPLSRYSF